MSSRGFMSPNPARPYAAALRAFYMVSFAFAVAAVSFSGLKSDRNVRYMFTRWIHQMRFAYPYELTAQPGGGFIVTFPDVPEAMTQGETEEEAAKMAEDALITALSFYTDDSERLPHPSPARGRRVAHVPPLVGAKLLLHQAMLAAGVSNVDLARRLGIDEKVARRLHDPLYKSRIDRVDKALRTLGKRIELVVREAADTDHDAAVPESSQVDRRGDNVVILQKEKNDRQQAARRQKMRA